MEDGNYKAAFEAGQKQSEVRKVEDGAIPFVVLPDGSNVHKLEDTLPFPLRRKGNPLFIDLESWITYVNKHRGAQTMLFAKVCETGAEFIAVLDHHGDSDEEAGWGQHTARYVTQPTVEWKRWSGSNKRQMSQKEFAEFLEENLVQIVKPAGAEMLEIARRFEAKTNVDFTTAVRLDNGNEEFSYEEKTEARAGEKGVLQVPSMFSIGLELFEGSVAYSIDARLRYRIHEKQLKLWYDLVNPHLAVKDAIKSMVDTVRQETEIAPLMGQP